MTLSRNSTGRASIVDVAKAAGVSRQTVSNVVNRPERVREETRKRVQDVIDHLGYRPSLAAQSLRAQRAGAVGIELNSLGERNRSDIVYPLLIELTVAAPQHACHIVPFASAEDQPMLSGYQDMVITHLVDAFIIADTHKGDPRPEWLRDNGVPFAAFGRVWDDPTFTAWADVDGAAGTATAVNHLVAHGYDRIGFLGWPEGSGFGDDRRNGWLNACAAEGLSSNDLDATTAQDIPEVTDTAADLVATVGKGGAVVCATDRLAIAAINAVRRNGWQVGTDFGITGFDDSTPARAMDLTTVRQPLHQIANQVLDLLQGSLDGAPAPREGTLFQPTLIERGSSRRG